MRKKILTALLSITLMFSATTLFSLPTTNAPSVTLAWDAPVGTNVIVGYNLYYGSATKNYTNIVSVGKTNQTTITLARGKTYFFAVTDIDTNGLESDYSSEIFYSTKTIPSAPGNFTFTTIVP